MAQTDSDYHLNVPMSRDLGERVRKQEKAWTGRKLVWFSVIFLAICLTVLFLMSSSTSETTWGDWLLPWPS